MVGYRMVTYSPTARPPKASSQSYQGTLSPACLGQCFDGDKHAAEGQGEKQREILLLEESDFEVVVNFERP